MEYPLISEYKEAILAAKDNFNELSSLRPVPDDFGNPMMSSGNFAVVFKMRDEHDGKLYAVKCFIKDQEGRDESYRKIADELETVSSTYILPLRYLENELFVDSAQCDRDEFPVVVMEWIEGDTLDAYLNRNINDKYELEMLSYRFNRMAAWLLTQPFAHGDLKPDNILVRKDGSLVLVDYDGMFVPSMKREKAREIGSPDYRHPSRTDADFDEHIDDFSIAVIALSLKAIALNPDLISKDANRDTFFFSEQDFCSPQESESLKALSHLAYDRNLSTLLGIFYIALAKNSLEALSFRLLQTDKPRAPRRHQRKSQKPTVRIDTSCSDKDIAEGVVDEFGVIYSADGKHLLKCKSDLKLSDYKIKSGTEVICDRAFLGCSSLYSVTIPNSVTTIGNGAFSGCESLKSITIPDSVTTIGNVAYWGCKSLQNVTIPDSVTSIGDGAFELCEILQRVAIPDSVTTIGNGAFRRCKSLQSVTIPDSVISLGAGVFSLCESLQCVSISNCLSSIVDSSFLGCESLLRVTIPDSVSSIGDDTFFGCTSLQSVTIPNSVSSIGNSAFYWCESLQSVTIPDSVKSIGNGAFCHCESLYNVTIPNSVTSISKGTFSYCESLQSITIPNSVTVIGEDAFYCCKSLQNVSLPDSLKTIGKCAFFGCDSLQSAAIPDTQVNIEDNAFPSDCLVFVW